jgi:hypothetical protein
VAFVNTPRKSDGLTYVFGATLKRLYGIDRGRLTSLVASGKIRIIIEEGSYPRYCVEDAERIKSELQARRAGA